MSDKITPEIMPVGTRALVRRRGYERSATEIRVLEWSPSMLRVRIEYSSGSTCWDEELPKYGILVEILPPAASHSCDEECPMLAVVRQYANLKNWDGSYKQWARESSGPETAQDALIDMLRKETAAK